MPPVVYVLYKRPFQPETLAIVRCLERRCAIGEYDPENRSHRNGNIYRAKFCVERNHPEWVTELPSIKDLLTGERFVGLSECIRFYECAFDVGNLTELLRDAA